MSVERLVRRALVEAAVAKFASDLCGSTSRILHAVGRSVDDLGNAIFYFELDAARRYRTLTGEDLGAGIGECDRHVMEPIQMAIPVCDEDEDDE